MASPTVDFTPKSVRYPMLDFHPTKLQPCCLQALFRKVTCNAGLRQTSDKRAVSRCCSHIRETLVKIMLSPASRHQSALEEDCGDAGQHGAIATRWGFGNTFDGEGLSIGPSACVFWCSVALGALVRGSPIESVNRMSIRSVNACAQRWCFLVVHDASSCCESCSSCIYFLVVVLQYGF